jgi:hypothetical protein
VESIVHWLLGLKGERIGSDAEWTVRFLSAPPLWITLLIVVPLIAGFVFVIYRREGRTAPAFARSIMAALRFLVIFLVILMIYDPVVSVERSLSRRSYVGILVDDSLSMQLQDHYTNEETKTKVARASGMIDADRFLTPEENARFAETSRMDLLKQVMKHQGPAFFDALTKDHRYKIYAFSSNVKRDVEFEKLKPEGRLTKIGEALKEVAADLKGQPVAGFLLFSDGCENAGLNALEMATELKKNDPPIPVHTVGVGSPDAPRDIQVMNPEAEETILVGDEWQVTVTVRQHGYDMRELELRLLEGDATVKSRPILLGPKEGEQKEKIVYTPPRPGRYTFHVEVPVQEGEVISDNNSVVVHVNVVDDKIRVLYVDHYPRWEYRYLKNALIRDTHMRVNVLLVAADPTFPQEKSPFPDVKPLQVFPETKKELFAFDVIILGDVNPEAETSRSIFLNPDRQMVWIDEFVRLLGGGVLFLAGENSMPYALEGTPLEALLPVMLPRGESLPTGPFTEPFIPERTPAGKANPILILDSDPSRNRRLWEEPRYALPGFYWYVPGLVEKPGATILARHPTKPPGMPPHKRDVIFAVQYYGAGKTFFSASDETWRWRFRYGDRWFYRFWRNAIRFVGQQRLLGEKKRFLLSVDKSEYILGEPVRISAKILDENYRPSVRPHQEIFMERPDGTTGKITLMKKLEEGSFEENFTPDQLGEYRIWIEEIMPNGETQQLSAVTFSVQVPRREYENPLMDRGVLREIAKASGGEFFFLNEIDQMIERFPELMGKREQVLPGMPVIHRLWDSWLAFVLLLGLLAAEWIYRKLNRLL